MWNAGLDELQAGIKIDERNNNSLRYVDDTTLMAESEEELKSLLMRVKEESEKASLKLNIKKTKIMASSPITAWQIEVEKMETVIDFLFLGSKITADSDCSHEIRRQLLLGRNRRDYSLVKFNSSNPLPLPLPQERYRQKLKLDWKPPAVRSGEGRAPCLGWDRSLETSPDAGDS